MKLRVYQTIENDVYVVTIVNDPAAISNQDKDAMAKFGEPEIDIGGSFGNSPNTYTLPSKLVKIRSDFPIRQEFDSRQTPFDTNTVTKVNSFRDAVVSRFSSAVSTLRGLSDTYTNESVYNI